MEDRTFYGFIIVVFNILMCVVAYMNSKDIEEFEKRVVAIEQREVVSVDNIIKKCDTLGMFIEEQNGQTKAYACQRVK